MIRFTNKLIFFGISSAVLYHFYKNYKQKKEGDDGSGPPKAINLMNASFYYKPRMASNVTQRLSEVKGIDEITEEITNLVKMIKDPHKYKSKGAKVPKGLILYGKPGTGKTMLARAIAGEAGVSFFYCTGSEFEEMFVGVGARRIRKLFETARNKSPSIIFIDEIDTLFT